MRRWRLTSRVSASRKWKSQTQIANERKSGQKNFSFTAAGSSRRVSAKKRVFVRHASLPCFQHGAGCSVGETGEKWKCKHTHTVAALFRDFTRRVCLCWSRRERGARTWMGRQWNSTEKMFISLALRRPEKNEIKTKRMPQVWRALHSCRSLSTRVGSVFAFRDEVIHSNYHGKISRKAPRLRWKFIFIWSEVKIQHTRKKLSVLEWVLQSVAPQELCVRKKYSRNIVPEVSPEKKKFFCSSQSGKKNWDKVFHSNQPSKKVHERLFFVSQLVGALFPLTKRMIIKVRLDSHFGCVQIPQRRKQEAATNGRSSGVVPGKGEFFSCV